MQKSYQASLHRADTGVLDESIAADVIDARRYIRLRPGAALEA
jgi:hypothetical protein